MTSLESATRRSPVLPDVDGFPEQVLSTLPGTDRPVIRYRVRLHERSRPLPAPNTLPRQRSEEPAAGDQPRASARCWRCVMDSLVADMPASVRISSLVAAVLLAYGTLMVAVFGLTGVAVVATLLVVLLTTHCYLGRHGSGRG